MSIRERDLTMKKKKKKKILVPVDGSQYSMRAVDYASAMAKHMNSEILLIHCHKSFPVVLGEHISRKQSIR